MRFRASRRPGLALWFVDWLFSRQHLLISKRVTASSRLHSQFSKRVTSLGWYGINCPAKVHLQTVYLLHGTMSNSNAILGFHCSAISTELAP